jgi:GNAT superfamily N-acetyltransferase
VPTWDGWGERTAEKNRTLRDRLFTDGISDGYLLYADDRPAGWCQCGPRDTWEKLRKAYDLEPDPEMWAVSCFFLTPPNRGKGRAAAFLDLVVEDLRRRGIKRVQGFPRRGEGLPADDVWTGPERLFRRAGFSLSRDHPRLPVYERNLEKTGQEALRHP